MVFIFCLVAVAMMELVRGSATTFANGSLLCTWPALLPNPPPPPPNSRWKKPAPWLLPVFNGPSDVLLRMVLISSETVGESA